MFVNKKRNGKRRCALSSGEEKVLKRLMRARIGRRDGLDDSFRVLSFSQEGAWSPGLELSNLAESSLEPPARRAPSISSRGLR